MPSINECGVDACSHNVGNACHALAITVGDQPHAQCDTYFVTSFKGRDPTATGAGRSLQDDRLPVQRHTGVPGQGHRRGPRPGGRGLPDLQLALREGV
jgi:hypothetical protein